MSAPFTHLEIKDWRTHQHYGKRRPPWIKLYTRLLDDVGFLALAEAAQAQLVKLWVLAASMGHPLPNDARLLVGKIGNPKRLYLPELIAAGFVVPCYHDASNVLAAREQNARPLSTENREQRTETTLPPPVASKGWQPIRERRIADLLPTEAGKAALAAILHTGQSDVGKAGIAALLDMMLAGERGEPHLAPAQLDLALCDYFANGMSSGGRFNAAHFRATAKRVLNPPPDWQPARRERPNPGAQAVANIMTPRTGTHD